MSKRAPAICPVCDEPVPPGAQACPKCGACERSGWSNEDEDTFDYESFAAKEFGDGRPRQAGGQWFWWAVSVAVLIGLAWGLLRSFL